MRYTHQRIKQKKKEQFQFKCMRQIQDERWRIRGGGTTKKETNQKHKRPTIQAWLQKLEITQHLRQTTDRWEIHTMDQPITRIRGTKWKENGKHKKLTEQKSSNLEQRNILKKHIYNQPGKRTQGRIKRNGFKTKKNHPKSTTSPRKNKI